MEKTLAVNAGSSSLKWQLYEMPEETVIAKGIFDHRQAVLLLMDELIHFKLIHEFREITGIGHRVVAGGEFFKTSTVISPEVLAEIKNLSTLAPLHNPANVLGIEAFQRLLPDALAVAVFDTAFHSTLPEKAYR